MVYKNNFTTSTQVKNTLKEVGVSLSGSAYKRLLHQRKYKRFPARCKPLVILTSRRARLQLAENIWKSLKSSGMKFFGPMKLEWEERSLEKRSKLYVKHGGAIHAHAQQARACMAANGTGSLEFCLSSVPCAGLYSLLILLKGFSKSLPRVSPGKKIIDILNILQWSSQSPDLNSVRQLSVSSPYI